MIFLNSRDLVSRLSLYKIGIKMEKKIINSIQSAEKVLIGIGELFQEEYLQFQNEEFIKLEKENPLIAGYKKISYLNRFVDDPVKEAYKKLKRLLQDKDYYIITTCNDDKIYSIGFEENRIVAPCGNFRFLQCIDNCSKELLPVTQEMISNEQMILCPYCNKPTCFNQIKEEHYNENGYLADWNQYNKWITSTINKKLCVLELGVGFKYPTVIRWPFEKIVYFNKKAKLYRIHDTLFQVSQEIKDKCYPINENPIDYLLNLNVE